MNISLLSLSEYNRIQSGFIVAAYQFYENISVNSGLLLALRIYDWVLIALNETNPPVSLAVCWC